MSWEIKRKSWEHDETYGPDATIEILDSRGRVQFGIDVAEVICSVGAKFVLAHLKQCIREGVMPALEVGLLAGEVSAYAALVQQKARRGKR